MDLSGRSFRLCLRERKASGSLPRQSTYQTMQTVQPARVKTLFTAGLGIYRKPATYSTVLLTISGTDGTVVPAGTLYAKAVTGENFSTDEEVTISSGTANVQATAVNSGQITTPVGTVTSIVTVITGVDSVTNSQAGTLGSAEETDEEFRRRKDSSLQVTGAGNDAAIRAKLLALTGVESVSVYSNRSSVTDPTGVEPNRYRAVIYPPAVDTEGEYAISIVNTLFTTMPPGIEPHGAQEYTVTDSMDNEHIVRFDYATGLDIYVSVDVVTTTDYPADGDEQIKAKVVEYGETMFAGSDVIIPLLFLVLYASTGDYLYHNLHWNH